MVKRELILKIKRKIMEYESKMNSYNKVEREHLDKILTFYEYVDNNKNNSDLIDLIYAGIILNSKKEGIEFLNNIEDELKEFLKKIDLKTLELYFNVAYMDTEPEEINRKNEIYKKESGLPEKKAEEIIKKSNAFLKVIRYIDINTAAAIYTFYAINGFCELNDYLLMDSKQRREFISTLNEYNDWLDLFNRIEAKKKEIKLENKRLNKLYSDKITKLNRLINNLEKNTNGEEITNIDELLDYAGEDFRHDILMYIKENNKICNETLERKYLNLKKNSISKFINIFGKNNIDFRLFNDAEKKIIMSRGYDFVERIINFFDKIGYKFKNEILLIIAGTTNGILSSIEEFIKKDYINSVFVRNNINVLLPSNDLDEVSYNLLIRNMNLLLDKGINIKGLDSDGMNFYVSSTKLIEENLSVIEESKVNIKTRNLKNYNFLGEEDLKSKINSLKELGVNINRNIEVLNSDINIIKRIKLCSSLGISIYDENKKIRKDILKKDLFFVPDSKIDEYVNEKTLVLN